MIQSVVQLPVPCPASWAGMTPTAAGRHCATCCTEVIDFTQMSSAEILAYWQQQQGKPVCGRLRVAQLLPAAPAKALRSRWRGWLGTLLAAGSMGAVVLPKSLAWGHANVGNSLGIANQRSSTNEAPAREALCTTYRATELAADSSVVKGVVRDARTKEPLPGIAVLVQGTRKITYTNADGEFTLKVASTSRRVRLLADFPGYKRRQQTIPTEAMGKTVVLELKRDAIMLGRITVPSMSSGG